MADDHGREKFCSLNRFCEITSPRIPTIKRKLVEYQSRFLQRSKHEKICVANLGCPRANPPTPIHVCSIAHIETFFISSNTHKPWFTKKEGKTVLFFRRLAFSFFVVGCVLELLATVKIWQSKLVHLFKRGNKTFHGKTR